MITKIFDKASLVATVDHTENTIQSTTGPEEAKFKRVFNKTYDFVRGGLINGHRVTYLQTCKKGSNGFARQVLIDIVRNELGYRIKHV